MINKIIGTILPDFFALFLLFFGYRSLKANEIRTIMNNSKLKKESRINDGINVNTCILELQKKMFIKTFFVPGFVSLITYCGLILKGGYFEWVLYTMVVIIFIFAFDCIYAVSNIDKNFYKVIKVHLFLIICLISSSIIGKILYIYI